MLFLDTLEVKAYSSGNKTFTGTIYFTLQPNASTDTYKLTSYSYSGTTTSSGSTSGSGSLYGSGSFGEFYYCDFDFPLQNIVDTRSKFGDYVKETVWGLSVTPSSGYVSNPKLTFADNGSSFNCSYKTSAVTGWDGTADVVFIQPILHFHFSFAKTAYSQTEATTFSVNYQYSCDVSDTTAEEMSIEVNDSHATEQLEDLNNTQESIKDTTEDTNSKITDFFGSFFDNLIGVFVPEANYFSNWFTRVNDLLADKLGILYFPFDFIIDTLTTINSNSSTSSGQIIFPEMSFTNSATSETYTLLNRQVINLNDYDVPFTSSENSSLVGTTNFTSLLSIIRLFTGIAFTLALVHLFIDKLHLILRGSERG